MPDLSGEITRQQAIYATRGEKVPRGYVIGRGLSDYFELLPASFPSTLRSLGQTDRWLDIGAGEGQAILDYYEWCEPKAAVRCSVLLTSKASAMALSIEDRRTQGWHRRAATQSAPPLRYAYGKRLREYTVEEIGRFQLITDVYGGFSYTDDLSTFVSKVLSLMQVHGTFYTIIQSVHLRDGSDKANTWYLTEIVDDANRDVTVCSWLQSITCTQVICDSKGSWDPPTELIQARKVCHETKVPPLKLLSYEAGTPPGRRFRLVR